MVRLKSHKPLPTDIVFGSVFDIPYSAMAWIIKAYIPVECDDPEVYAAKEDAEKDLESLSLMQPENICEIEEPEET